MQSILQFYAVNSVFVLCTIITMLQDHKIVAAALDLEGNLLIK